MENFNNVETTVNNNVNVNYNEFSKLKFNGSCAGVIGRLLLIGIGHFFTLGLLTPFLMDSLFKYFIENTTYKSKNLRFEGKYGKLYIKFIVCGLLKIFTFGISFLAYVYYFVKCTIENIIIE